MLFSTSVVILGAILASAVVATPSHDRIARAVHRRATDHYRRETLVARSSPIEYAPTWSGAVWDVDDQGTFTSATGTFTVPKVWGPDGAVSAAWVGIDGRGRSPGLLQAGVDMYIVGNATEYDVWYEWFPDMPNGFDTQIDVSQGDVFRITIEAQSATSGSAMVENLSTGQVGYKNLTSTNWLCRQSAEWILEDYEGDDAPLPYFTPVTFTHAEAKGGNKTYTPLGAAIVDIEQNGVILTSVTTGQSNVTIRRLGN